jgi:Immunoglobulin I-set domain
VALDIIDLIAEDSGIYTCRAVNMLGADETNCNLKVTSKKCPNLLVFRQIFCYLRAILAIFLMKKS